jgi:hypothetical protein
LEKKKKLGKNPFFGVFLGTAQLDFWVLKSQKVGRLTIGGTYLAIGPSEFLLLERNFYLSLQKKSVLKLVGNFRKKKRNLTF